jgi:hypothetical protein
MPFQKEPHPSRLSAQHVLAAEIAPNRAKGPLASVSGNQFRFGVYTVVDAVNRNQASD